VRSCRHGTMSSAVRSPRAATTGGVIGRKLIFVVAVTREWTKQVFGIYYSAGISMGKRPEHCDFGRADRRSETSRQLRLMRTLWVVMLLLCLSRG
jgi:hypothetical protein